MRSVRRGSSRVVARFFAAVDEETNDDATGTIKKKEFCIPAVTQRKKRIFKVTSDCLEQVVS